MQRMTNWLAGLCLIAAAAGPARAQDRDRVPSGFEPPRGMCRIWIGGVPATQQPAPTDCATAIRRRPGNARVIFGEPVRNDRELDAARARLGIKELGGRRRTDDAPSRRRDADRTPADRTPADRTPADRAPVERAQDSRRDMRRDPPASRRTEPVRPSSQGRTRTVPIRPTGGGYEDDLASERWNDARLMAELYGDGPAGPAALGEDEAFANGRATPRQRTGERGRGRFDGDRLLDWASGPDGAPLYASDVERMLRLQQALSYGEDDGSWDEGLVGVVPGACYDRNFDGRCDDLSMGADGCYDRNSDGRCDDARWDALPGGRGSDAYGSGVGRGRLDDRRGTGALGGLCYDRDRDGRCDEPWSNGRQVPQTLPEMSSATALHRGAASYDVERWLRRNDVSARATDRDHDGLPERIVWLDPRGQVVQVWSDRDGDGVADRVELYQNGLPVQVIER